MSTTDERESLAAKFEHHAEEEGKLLADYRVLGDQLGDDILGNLVSHILTEEEMHHLLLCTMAKWLRQGSMPTGRLPQAERAELLRLTQKLQRHEEDTIDACSGLQARLEAQNEELLTTLLDAMILDTEKHRRLLALVEKMLKTGC